MRRNRRFLPLAPFAALVALVALVAAAPMIAAPLASAATTPAAAPTEAPWLARAPERCPASREFITTLEFLRAQSEMHLPEPEARKVADRVASGCEGAAGRFIRVTRVLSAAGLSGRDAVANGIELANRTDREAETFTEVFKRAFLQEYLDLDLGAALAMARSLTTEFRGDTHAVLRDFGRVLDFCVGGGSGLDLPRPQCGALATRIARHGQEWGGPVSEPFLAAYEFAKSEKGPHLPTGPALKLAEELISRGPDGPENFSQGFRYAFSKDGLALPLADAIRFGKEMAAKAASADSKAKRQG